MVFNSVKEINRLRKEINRLLIQGMSNIYLKVTIENNWSTQNFDYLSLKNLPPSKFLGSSNSCRYHWISKLLVTTQKSEVWEQNSVWLFWCVAILILKGIIWRFEFKESYILLNRINLERRTLCLSSYKNSKLEIKLRWVGTREKKKKIEGMFCTIYFLQMKNFLIHVLYRSV